MIDIATTAEQLYEEISTCQGTEKAPSSQVEADYFNIDSNRGLALHLLQKNHVVSTSTADVTSVMT
ncbi:TPA: hypothetical protein ACH3X2_005456 [Trebouxia sp. C0005]